MTDHLTPAVHPMGEAMVRELLAIHRMLRRDLQQVRSLAQALAAGAPAADIRAGIGELAIKSPVWALRLHCRHYCEFVRLHHGLEDRMLFPSLRRVFPELAPALDKLESDHEEVAGLLEGVDSAVAVLVEDETRRGAAVTALDRLADHLLAHLDYEEQSLSPALGQLDDWPW